MSTAQMDDASRNAERAAERLEYAKMEAAEAIEKAEKLRQNREKLAANQAERDKVKAEFFAFVASVRARGLYLTARETRDVALDLLRVNVAELTIRPDAEEIGIVKEERTKTGETVYRHYRINEAGALVKNGLPALGGKGKNGKAPELFDT